MILRTGLDLVEIHRLATLRQEIRERFIQRVFTQKEQQDCAGRLEKLSGRFAAKEAVAKALGCGIGLVGWQEIEILSGVAGEPKLLLRGKASAMAEKLGLVDWSISITHTRTHAAAMAVALGATPP
jgi:holo-[acyl-carrier protein] synthase